MERAVDERRRYGRLERAVEASPTLYLDRMGSRSGAERLRSRTGSASSVARKVGPSYL